MWLQNLRPMKKLHFYIPSKPPFDLWSSSFAPRHSLQAVSALGLSSLGKGRLVASLHYSVLLIKVY